MEGYRASTRQNNVLRRFHYSTHAFRYYFSECSFFVVVLILDGAKIDIIFVTSKLFGKKVSKKIKTAKLLHFKRSICIIFLLFTTRQKRVKI